MAYVFKDVDGNEHELYDNNIVEEIIEITSGDVIGYRVKGVYSSYSISKETYDAIKKVGR